MIFCYDYDVCVKFSWLVFIFISFMCCTYFCCGMLVLLLDILIVT
jgi:hypothetical protein